MTPFTHYTAEKKTMKELVQDMLITTTTTTTTTPPHTQIDIKAWLFTAYKADFI